jgi:hypothetical protein
MNGAEDMVLVAVAGLSHGMNTNKLIIHGNMGQCIYQMVTTYLQALIGAKLIHAMVMGIYIVTDI